MDRITKTAKVLKLLKNNERVTNRELNRICFRYGSCIHELRKEGHVIKTNRLNNDGLYEYIYHGLSDEAKLDNHLEQVKKNPERYDRNLIKRTKQWL